MKSAWERYAGERVAYPALETSLDCDLLVIGGGFTGLSTALHAAKSGVKVALLEAETIGSMASGRNGGQVVPGPKVGLEVLERKYGVETATQMVKYGFESAKFTFDLIAEEQIDCDATFNGWIHAAFAPASDEHEH